MREEDESLPQCAPEGSARRFHADGILYEEAGGWDTTIRKSQYERLFYNQQLSMMELYQQSGIAAEETVRDDVEAKDAMPANAHASQVSVHPRTDMQAGKAQIAAGASGLRTRSKGKSAPTRSGASLQEDEFKPVYGIDSIEVGRTVRHKQFGLGTVSRIDKSGKYIHVRFPHREEKKFIFPNAFIIGHLELV